MGSKKTTLKFARFAAELRAAKLRAERTSGPVACSKVAKLVGVSASSVYAYLRGETLPDTKRLDELLAALNISGPDAKRLADLRESLEMWHRGEGAGIARGAEDCPETETTAREVLRHNDLPRDIAVLHGRERELDEVITVVGDGGTVCVLSGLGGVGKTALAVRAARHLLSRFPDGCLFLDLRGYAAGPVVAPAVAAGALLRQMGVAAESIPAQPDSRLLLLRDKLGAGKYLVLLDNVVDSAHVAPLLPGAGACAIIVTSRGTLNGLDEVDRVPIGRLSEDDALALLDRLTRGLPPGRVPSASQRAAIARQCHGLPVAIRIAAAILRSEMWPMAEHGEPLVALEMLHDGDRDVESLFEYSVVRLPPESVRAFTVLGLHPGTSFDIGSGAALMGIEPADMWRHLRLLIEVSLLEPAARGRYRCHDLVREFARRRAAVHCDRATARAALVRLVEHYTAFADGMDRVLTPSRHRGEMAPGPRRVAATEPTYQEAMLAMTAERDNLAAVARAAFEHGLDEQCWQIAFAVRGFAFIAKDIELWTETHELAVTAAVRAGNQYAEAVTCNNLGLALMTEGEPAAAAVRYEQARALFVRLGDRHGEHTALAHQAWVHVRRREFEQALELSLRALAFADLHGAPRNRAILLRDTALIEVSLGRHLDALPRLLEAAEMFRTFNLFADEAMTANVLGDAYLSLGDFSDAREAFEHAVALGQMACSAAEQARGHAGLAKVADARGEQAVARHHRRSVIDLSTQVGDTVRVTEIVARSEAVEAAPASAGSRLEDSVIA
ncbi:helix-turn-helix transcriptional regulator [Nocardia salmonicida]|uniref:helix-turn-helix transcriptional regulator n=1 Tax=Nocardia salmonicida TaxID=53431 RepID=UPI0007A4EEEB|nr:helix-turn-helix transcriptional regulator [Nocardia salmonicida]